ncbi:hypothetical protein ACRDNQ_16645 [Palleronia sp. KMU-117]
MKHRDFAKATGAMDKAGDPGVLRGARVAMAEWGQTSHFPVAPR